MLAMTGISPREVPGAPPSFDLDAGVQGSSATKVLADYPAMIQNDPRAPSSSPPAAESPSGDRLSDVPPETPIERPAPREIGGREGPEPTRFGDWEKSGRCIDF
jgi:hypothetical protein